MTLNAFNASFVNIFMYQLYEKNVANNWIKEKFHEVEAALEKLGNEFQGILLSFDE